MKKLLSLLFCLNYGIIYAQPGEFRIEALLTPKNHEKILTVGSSNADIPGFTNKAIQFAIDALSPDGGTVMLTRGSFEIMSPVHLRSNINLIGSGVSTVLKKSDGIQTNFIVDADYGELKLTVKNPAGFLPGMKVQITDAYQNDCWDVSTALITDIVDSIIYIDSYLIRDYRSDHNGLISNASSVIEIVNEQNVVIKNLMVNGNKEKNFKMDGCNGAGIYIFKSKQVTIDCVKVNNFYGEGISWQITENVTVMNSEIGGNGNNGLHPGTGSPGTIIQNNNIHNNSADGLYVCWRVHHSLVSSNQFHDNGRFGICTGYKDTDVLFEKNHIYSNGSDGINLRIEKEENAPHRNTISNNIIENNGVKNGGYGISVNVPANDIVIKDNIIRNSKDGNQKAGIYIYKNGNTPQLENNNMSGHTLKDIVYEKSAK